MRPEEIDVPMPILTPRLLLRPPAMADAEALHDMKVESAREFYSWMPWAKEPSTLLSNEMFISDCMEKFSRMEDMVLFAFERDGGRLVMSTGLHRFDWTTRVFEIGYITRTSATGRGYARESTNALLRYAFNALAAKQVRICHLSGNEASRRVIEACGFTPTYVDPQSDTTNDGRVVDKHWYARTNLDGLPPLDVAWR